MKKKTNRNTPLPQKEYQRYMNKIKPFTKAVDKGTCITFHSVNTTKPHIYKNKIVRITVKSQHECNRMRQPK